jgi:hypothetical protein
MLMVERGPADLLEEGGIYFQAGRATFAAVERVRGQDALNVLGGWGACRFAFDPDAPAPAPNLSQPQAPAGPSYERQSPPPGYYNPPSQAAPQRNANPPSWYAPPANTPQSQPAIQPYPYGAPWLDPRVGSNPGMTNTNNGFNSHAPTHPSGVFGAPSASGSLPGSGALPPGWPLTSGPITGPTGASLDLTPPPQGGQTQPGASASSSSRRPPARAEANLLRRPRRAPSAQDLLAVVRDYQLSRAHRTLLMLADGEHNVIDMARLSSKQIEEVQALLSELEGHGLIYYY